VPVQNVAYDDVAKPIDAGLDYLDLTANQKDHFDGLFGPGGNLLTDVELASGSRSGEELSSNTQLVVVPEPTSLAIFGLGLLGLAGAARRKNS